MIRCQNTGDEKRRGKKPGKIRRAFPKQKMGCAPLGIRNHGPNRLLCCWSRVTLCPLKKLTINMFPSQLLHSTFPGVALCLRKGPEHHPRPRGPRDTSNDPRRRRSCLGWGHTVVCISFVCEGDEWQRAQGFERFCAIKAVRGSKEIKIWNAHKIVRLFCGTLIIYKCIAIDYDDNWFYSPPK